MCSIWNVLCEDDVNRQINVEYMASYQYHLMWTYFARSEVGLDNIAEYFKKAAAEEREHAEKLMAYQCMRGGKVVLTSLEPASLDYLNNTEDNSNCIMLSFKKALAMEEEVYAALLKLHEVGDQCKDPQFSDFIEGEYLEEQVNAIHEIKKYIAQLKLIGNCGQGLWEFNRLFENE